MLDRFLDAWSLFAEAWTTGLLLGALLPIAGVLLVAREQVFLSAAIGQSATFGIAVVLALGLGESAGGVSHDESFALAGGMLAAVAAAIATARGQTQSGSGLQARAAWIFLAAGSGAVLVLTHDPHGLAEVHRLMLSTLLGASPWDVGIAALLLGLAGGTAVALRDRLLLWTLDPVTTQVLGLRVARYDWAIGAAVGIVTGFAIHAAGLVFTFGATILPVLAARSLARSLAGVIWLAPFLGAAQTLVGLLVAHESDLPPGQAAVAVMAVVVLLSRLRR